MKKDFISVHVPKSRIQKEPGVTYLFCECGGHADYSTVTSVLFKVAGQLQTLYYDCKCSECGKEFTLSERIQIK